MRKPFAFEFITCDKTEYFKITTWNIFPFFSSMHKLYSLHRVLDHCSQWTINPQAASYYRRYASQYRPSPSCCIAASTGFFFPQPCPTAHLGIAHLRTALLPASALPRYIPFLPLPCFVRSRAPLMVVVASIDTPKQFFARRLLLLRSERTWTRPAASFFVRLCRQWGIFSRDLLENFSHSDYFDIIYFSLAVNKMRSRKWYRCILNEHFSAIAN